MGVPWLFRELARAYPRAIEVTPPSPSAPLVVRGLAQGCEVLYVDFNSLIHEALNALLHDTNDAANDASSCQEDVAEAVVQGALDRLDAVEARLRPRRLMFVATDGTPPRAKMEQQRARRYIASTTLHPSSFHRNAITPGTSFMAHMDAALQAWALASPTRLASGSDEPGEGEQKLLLHLRAHPPHPSSSPEDFPIAVLGLDADLVLMCVSHPSCEWLRVVREDAETGVQVVHAGRLSHAIQVTLHGAGQAGQGPCREIVALVSMLGNDFMPALPALRIPDGGLRRLLEAYRAAAQEHPEGPGAFRIASAGPDALGGLSPGALLQVLSHLAADEELRCRTAAREHARFLAHHGRHRKNRSSGFEKHDPTLEAPFTHPPPWTWTQALGLGEGAGWRTRWRRMMLRGCGGGVALSKPSIPPPAEVGCTSGTCSACACASPFPSLQRRQQAEDEAYIATLAWSLAYLADQRCLSEGWACPWAHAAPAAGDLVDSLRTALSQKQDHLNPTAALGSSVAAAFSAADEAHARARSAFSSDHSGAWHLLMVMPRTCLALSRDEAPRLASIAASTRCSAMFPDPNNLLSVTYLRRRTHECVPLLPPMDLGMLGDGIALEEIENGTGREYLLGCCALDDEQVCEGGKTTGSCFQCSNPPIDV